MSRIKVIVGVVLLVIVAGVGYVLMKNNQSKADNLPSTTVVKAPPAATLPYSLVGAAGAYASGSDEPNKSYYFFGGVSNENGSNAVDTIIKYNIANHSSEVVPTKLPRAISYAYAHFNHNDEKFYIFGGYPDTYSKKIMTYDPKTNVVEDLGDKLPVPVQHAAVSYDVVNNSLYFFGGVNEHVNDFSQQIFTTNYSSSVVEYSFYTKTATLRTEKFPYYIADASASWSPTTKKSYIFGGERQLAKNGNQYIIVKQIFEFDPSTKSLKVLGAALPVGLTHASTVWNETTQKVVFYGGTSVNGASKKIYEFNPTTGTFLVTSGTLDREAFGMSTFYNKQEKKVYLFGGMRQVNDTYEYRATNEIWVH